MCAPSIWKSGGAKYQGRKKASNEFSDIFRRKAVGKPLTHEKRITSYMQQRNAFVTAFTAIHHIPKNDGMAAWK